ncbi:two-component regulator propeller domain-containing protein [Lutibacter sp.]
MLRITPFLITFFLFQATLFAQIPGFTQFNSNNGLPSNTVYDINQDENGLIWIATDYGLSRFDGLSFKNFTVADGLPDNEILTIFKDSKKRIWLIGFNGKLGYIKNNIFYNETNQDFLKKLSFNNYVSDIYEDSQNNIWFLQSVNSVKKLDTLNNVTNYTTIKIPFKSKSRRSLIVEDINGKIKILISSINKDNSLEILSSSIINQKWVPINLSLFSENTLKSFRRKKAETFKCIDKITAKISTTIFNDFGYNRTTNNLYRILPFEDSFLITNLNQGALIINLKYPINNKKILPSIHTTKSFVDRENNIWIGSQSSGIYLLPNLHTSGIQFKNSKKNDLYVVNMFQNKLIIGNEQSEIILLDINTLKVITSYIVDEFPKKIRHLKTANSSLYILSNFNLQTLTSDLKIKPIKNMFEMSFQELNLKNFKDISISENYIYTANAKGVAKITKKTNATEKIWDKRSTAILHKKNGNLWIGTTSGLYYYNQKTVKKYDVGELFNNSIIYTIKNSTKGLLIGSNSYGLGILKNGDLKIISTNEGLLSNYIKSIFIDAKNKIWLSTNFGLNSIDLNKNNEIITIESYTTSDGLYSNDVRSSYVFENKVYVATAKGLNIIDLSKESTSIQIPSIHINEILLNNKNIEQTNGQIFTNQQNNFQFNFSGISFRSLGNITFKYRLLGLETDWITTKTNTIRYSSLPPNNYTFEVKAISKNHLESTPHLFTFTINPPIHRTWWFQSILTIFIFATIAFIFYKRNLNNKRTLQTKEQISNLRYQALNAQMNPHFINNLLVNINALADEGEIEEVKSSLSKFAELVNLVLNSTKSNLINLSDEIEMSKLYLELQKLRFNKNISYAINTNSISKEEIETILVPPMILQPIIENSFKHGFKNGDSTNTITVDFRIENEEFLYCEISDNGKGVQTNESFLKSKEIGISFSNINERLQLISESTKKEKLVVISNITDEFNTLVGLKVTLKIPFISF